MHANKYIDLKVPQKFTAPLVKMVQASPLLSIIYGFYHADAKEMTVNGERYKPANSQEAIKAGIAGKQHYVGGDFYPENIVLKRRWMEATRKPWQTEETQSTAEDYGWKSL